MNESATVWWDHGYLAQRDSFHKARTLRPLRPVIIAIGQGATENDSKASHSWYIAQASFRPTQYVTTIPLRSVAAAVNVIKDTLLRDR